MSEKNKALIFVFMVSAGGAFFAVRMYPSDEWIPLGIMSFLFFGFGLLIIFLGKENIRFATTEVKAALKKVLEKEAEPYHEKQVALELRDIKVLERYVPWTYAGLIFSALATALFFSWDEFFSTSSTTRFIARLVIGFLGGAALLVSAILLMHFKSRSKRIRKGSTKTVIRGIVTGRRVDDLRLGQHDPRREHGFSGEVFYYLKLGEKEFDIDFKNFSQTTEGDAVEIHYVTDAVGKALVLHFYLLKKEIVLD